MLNEEEYMWLECSYAYSKAILEVLKEDDITITDLWRMSAERGGHK